jgi:hypothetical protein
VISLVLLVRNPTFQWVTAEKTKVMSHFPYAGIWQDAGSIRRVGKEHSTNSDFREETAQKELQGWLRTSRLPRFSARCVTVRLAPGRDLEVSKDDTARGHAVTVYDERGACVHNLKWTDGGYAMVTGLCRIGGRIWCASLQERALMRFDLPG